MVASPPVGIGVTSFEGDARMAKKDREEEDGLGNILFGDAKPQLKDLADPRKRKQALRVAKMLGFEIRREQMIRLGIVSAVVLVLLLVGLWAVAKVLGLLFWVAIALAGCYAVSRLIKPGPPHPKEIPTTPVRTLESSKPDNEAWNREAEDRADRALEELEKRLKG
jgi:hypothetical protein